MITTNHSPSPMDFQDFIFQSGYIGLFVISVLAASVIPLSSEVFVLAMPALGYDVWLVGLVATAGNYLGALSVYYMGKMGSDFILTRYITIEPAKLERAQAWFGRWGPAALLMCWAPIVGDPLCGVAGMLHMNFWRFSLWAMLGKGARYLVLLGAWGWLVGF